MMAIAGLAVDLEARATAEEVGGAAVPVVLVVASVAVGQVAAAWEAVMAVMVEAAVAAWAARRRKALRRTRPALWGC